MQLDRASALDARRVTMPLRWEHNRIEATKQNGMSRLAHSSVLQASTLASTSNHIATEDGRSCYISAVVKMTNSEYEDSRFQHQHLLSSNIRYADNLGDDAVSLTATRREESIQERSRNRHCDPNERMS